jgi:hypothetical protein
VGGAALGSCSLVAAKLCFLAGDELGKIALNAKYETTNPSVRTVEGWSLLAWSSGMVCIAMRDVR